MQGNLVVDMIEPGKVDQQASLQLECVLWRVLGDSTKHDASYRLLLSPIYGASEKIPRALIYQLNEVVHIFLHISQERKSSIVVMSIVSLSEVLLYQVLSQVSIIPNASCLHQPLHKSPPQHLQSTR